MRSRGKASSYKYFIFLNSSVRGPFWPAYMPPDWSWTRAYTDRLRGRVKVVSSSLVCLPEIDAGGPGLGCALSPSGVHVAVTLEGSRLVLWERRADEWMVLLRADDVGACEFTPDGDLLLTYGSSAENDVLMTAYFQCDTHQTSCAGGQ